MSSDSPGLLRRAKKRRGSARYRTCRLIILTGAFLLILINPFINFYLHNNFIQGWYQSFAVGKLWFVSPLEGIESLLLTKEFYVPTLVGILLPILLALFLGRVFCSWICPVSFILELFDRLRLLISRRKTLRNRLIIAKQVIWFTLIGELLISMILGTPLFVFLSPPGLIGREIMTAVFFHKLPIEGVLILIVIFLELITRRFFCRSFCPLGGLLAFFGRKRALKVVLKKESCVQCRRCSQVCPMGLNASLGEAQSAYCWNCGDCIDSCSSCALHFAWKTFE